ncbi:MAG: IS1595 family transposase [Patescibacteria group bacterium]
MKGSLTLKELNSRFSTDDQCLEYIKEQKFPDGIPCKKCKLITPHYRLKKRHAYSCEFCGSQTYPLVGTIFKRTRVPLTVWFQTIYLVTKFLCGVAAKAIERIFGFSYRTCWRMLMRIRSRMREDGEMLKRIVEVDETFVGGKGYNRGRIWWANWEEKPKEIVMGMVERRKGGKVITKHIPDTSRLTLSTEIQKYVSKGSWIMSDAHWGYWGLSKKGYLHNAVNHSKYFVRDEIYTQNIESFWSHPKRGITGVYRHVSKKYLQLYFDEYAFRYNHREEKGRMFEILLKKIVKFD